MAGSVAIEYLARAYEENGYKVVAMALRTHGANAEKFKIEVAAIEAAIAGTREEDAVIADGLDASGRIGRAVRQALQMSARQAV